jgi:hypothetical protein
MRDCDDELWDDQDREDDDCEDEDDEFDEDENEDDDEFDEDEEDEDEFDAIPIELYNAVVLDEVPWDPKEAEELFQECISAVTYSPRETTRARDLYEMPTLDDEVYPLAAAVYLGSTRDPRAVEPLISMLSADLYECVAAAAWALGAIGDERAVGPLKEALENDGFDTLWECGLPLSEGMYDDKQVGLFDTIQDTIFGYGSDVSPIVTALKEIEAKKGSANR